MAYKWSIPGSRPISFNDGEVGIGGTDSAAWAGVQQDGGGNEEGETRGETVHGKEVAKAAVVGRVWLRACWEQHQWW